MRSPQNDLHLQDLLSKVELLQRIEQQLNYPDLQLRSQIEELREDITEWWRKLNND